jgi:Protein of unknown function (DUF2752)
MTGAPATTTPATRLVHRHHQARVHRRAFGGTVSIEGKTAARLAAVLLAAGAVLSWSPIHPGLLCPLRAATGIPCPACGMTTSIKECFRADLAGAFAANPGGIAAVLAAIALVVFRPAALTVRWTTVGLVVAVLWVFQLFRFQVL